MQNSKCRCTTVAVTLIQKVDNNKAESDGRKRKNVYMHNNLYNMHACMHAIFTIQLIWLKKSLKFIKNRYTQRGEVKGQNYACLDIIRWKITVWHFVLQRFV